jgi:hypothetical protein
MSLDGMVATMTIEEATNADIFLAFVEQVLCPALKQGDRILRRQSTFILGTPVGAAVLLLTTH